MTSDSPRTLTDEEIAAIQARAEKATPGPWRKLGACVVLAEEGVLPPFSIPQTGDDLRHIAGLDPLTAIALCAMAKAKIAAEERVRELEAALQMSNDACEAVVGQFVLGGLIGELVDEAMDNAARVLASLSAEKEENRSVTGDST